MENFLQYNLIILLRVRMLSVLFNGERLDVGTVLPDISSWYSICCIMMLLMIVIVTMQIPNCKAIRRGFLDIIKDKRAIAIFGAF